MIKDIKKKNVIWNLIFSIISAAQSVLLLLFVNRISGEINAGIFGFAFSVAVLLMYIGNYGIRNFQVSDTKEIYSPFDYYGFRFISVLLMILCLAIYLFIFDFSNEKLLTIIFLSLERTVESVEDVFHGRFQQKGNLYKAGFQGTVRFIISDLFFLISLLITKSLALASFFYFFSSLIIVIYFAFISLKNYGGFKLEFNISKLKGLVVGCFPLFAGYFLTTYLTNAAKYTIESFINKAPDLFDEKIQAYFNMIFMPVLMINLLSTVIFRPIIVDMANYYNNGNLKEYNKIVKKQYLYIVLIAILILPLCYFFGIPILSWFYSSNLSDYRIEFLILMLGGVFSAFSSFLNVCIITIRHQKELLISSFLIALTACIIFNLLNPQTGLLSISIVYLIIMVLQALIYFIIHLRGVNSSNTKSPIIK